MTINNNHQTAEDYLRGKYGAHRGHFAWRELEEAFNAGNAAQLMPDGWHGFATLVVESIAEAEKAIRKFPQPNYTLLKVAEEAGEVVKAGVHFAEGRDTAEHVRDEMRQNIAMLYRLWIEGDQRNGVPAISLAVTAEMAEKGDQL